MIRQDWPTQKKGVSETIARLEAGVSSLCLTSPTGGGKSLMMQRLCEWAVSNGKQVSVLTNRKLLTNQLANGLASGGIHVGVRAADFEAWTDPNAPVQICSVQTELSRVIGKRKKAVEEQGMSEGLAEAMWGLHQSELVLIDEVHLNKGNTVCGMIDEFKGRYGAQIVGVSATPLGVSHICSELVIAGNNSDLRSCGALVPAMCYEPGIFDLPKIRRSKTGLFTQSEANEAVKAIWSQHVVGHIYDHWKELNPNAKPTLGMAPGRKESLGLATDFHKRGVNAAHICSSHIFINGKQYTTNEQKDRDEIFAMSKDGRCPIIFNRFVLREAIDLPWLEHLILATPIASLLSYIQTCLDQETEVLTKRGWVGHSDIRNDDTIAQMDMSTGKSSWSKCLSITNSYVKPGDEMVSIESPHLNIRVTGSHDMIVRSPKALRWRKQDASAAARRAAVYVIPVSSDEDVVDAPFTDDEIRLAAWFATDGGFNRANQQMQISQSAAQPKEFHESIASTLDALSLGYSAYRIKRTGDYAHCQDGINYVVNKTARTRPGKVGWMNYSHLLDKNMPQCLMCMSRRQLLVFLEVANMADGAKPTEISWVKKTYDISKGNFKFLSRLQELCVMRGVRSNISTQLRDGFEPIYVMHACVEKSIAYIGGTGESDSRSSLVTSASSGESVWCVQTECGTIFTRRMGKVAIVGNCGRVLRASPSTGKKSSIISDHGGSIRLHGSPNLDRDQDWKKYFHENDASKITRDRVEGLRDPAGTEKEPIVCPKCQSMRKTGSKCPMCGFEHQASVRLVIQETGKLKKIVGDFFPKRRVETRTDTEKLWASCYYRCKNAKRPMTFNQARALFVKTHGYTPPANLPLMPKSVMDWSRKIASVPMSDVHRAQRVPDAVGLFDRGDTR